MSTRACVATVRGDGWQGVYVHGSGYPTSLGPEIWGTLHARYQGNVTAFAAQELTAHSYGYSSYPDDCYCHNWEERDGTEMVYTHEDEETEALFIEWVYVLGSRVLTVFKSLPTGRDHRCENAAGHWWMEPVYRWALVAQVALEEAAPDWQMIEERGQRLRNEAHHTYERSSA